MLANIVEKWCLRGWYKNQKIPDLCGGAEQLQSGVCTQKAALDPHDNHCAALSIFSANLGNVPLPVSLSVK
ncbi:hypothetical protein [Endozoicomonas sp. SCSIO W0465]|uniref:hypothetical protein n=1 Tax=Endozoicomonas sp. SCSIO W0465 TaxID=2918516 RepID=UPI00207603D3|nr:hypothetical protein [Endozoicomonas sp. SCSIO W0465]USE34168.1 hypothetical protein MJO57_18595 [Endozoicomonas sp. SCSIO W0465]